MVRGSKLESGTPWVRNRSANHYTDRIWFCCFR